MINNKSYIPDWDRLKYLLNAYNFKTTLLFPIITMSLYFLIRIFSPIENIFIEFKLSNYILWDLKIFYLGLIVLTLGSILYSIFCPSLITQFATRENFIDHKIRLNDREEFIIIFNLLSKNNIVGNYSPKSISNQILYSRYYDLVINNSLLIRTTITLFFIVGIILCSLPLINKAVTVLNYLF